MIKKFQYGGPGYFTSAYGREYAPLIKDFEALRECLKCTYKMGGKLIFKYEKE